MTDFIPLGTRVRVSDGEPRPPDRFNRKLRAWKNNNFEGVVVEHREPCQYVPYPTYAVQHTDYLTGYIRVIRSAIAMDKVEPMEFEPSFKVEHGCVVGHGETR